MKRWTAENLQRSPWFQELLVNIQDALARQRKSTPDPRPKLSEETAQIERLMQGWSQSLGNPDLPRALRSRIESEYSAAEERLNSINAECARFAATQAIGVESVSPQFVANRLNRLAEILESQNPTRTYLELSLHIDRILGYEDGHVVVRTCKLGALAGVAEGLADSTRVATREPVSVMGISVAKPRRRARLQVNGTDEEGGSLDDATYYAADVDRFKGLGPEWFWEDVFSQPRKVFWPECHADEVGRLRLAGATEQALALRFGKNVHTIRKALAIAASRDPRLQHLPRKMPRARWPEHHYLEVAELDARGFTQKQMCEHFGKCETLIRQALTFAKANQPGANNSGRLTSLAD